MRRMLAIGTVAAVAAVVNAAPAVAATPVSLSFDNVVLNTPATPNLVVLKPSGTPLTVIANVDPATGSFTIAPSGFQFPTYPVTVPLPGTVSLALSSPATGRIDFSTGQVSLIADFQANLSFTGLGTCAIDTGTLTLSTRTTKPLPGKAFPTGAAGIVTGPGAFGTSWKTLPAGTGSGCPAINAALDGPGGIWISTGISPSSAGATKLAVTASSKNAKAGKTATLSVTVKNTGAARASGVKVCATASKPLKPTKPTCRTIGTLKSGAKKSVAFKLATTSGKTGRFAVKIAVTATGLKSTTTTTAKIKVTN